MYKEWIMATSRNKNFSLVFFLGLVVLLFLLFCYNNHVYHFLLDFLIILVSFSIFVFALSTQKYADNSFYLMLGTMSSFVGILYLYHFILFQSPQPHLVDAINVSLKIHLLTLFLESISFLIAPFFLKTKKSTSFFIGLLTIVFVCVIVLLSFQNLIPRFYDSNGITNFALYSSLFIGVILVVSLFIYKKIECMISERNHTKIIITLLLLLVSIVLVFLVKLIPNSPSFFIHLSHLMQFCSFYLIFDCIFSTGINYPLDVFMNSFKQDEEMYSAIFNTMQEGISIIECNFSKDGVYTGFKIIQSNQSFKELTRSGDKKIITINEINKDAENMYWFHLYRDICEYKKPMQHIRYNKTTQKTYEIHSFYLDSFRICTLLHDITQRTIIEKEQNEFISTTTHELKTPVAAIKESFTLLMNTYEKDQSKIQIHLQDICRRNISRLQNLVNQVMDYHRYDQKNVKHYTLEQINDIITEVVQDLSPVAYTQRTKITCDLHKNIPMFKMEKESFRRVFLNLLNNAIKFTENGTITVTSMFQNKTITISFKDTGMGISKDKLTHIFEPFSCASRETKGNTNGSGLGLSITKKIVESYGGSIKIDSHPNTGTDVVVTIPITTNQDEF